ncbi:MAG: efflux RND transporter periplasmic adaptor subunit [Muribaculaceae bacterium]|nr:efflux RND transporter periplasmic adaptor subunit [Muribaculaceae bacterium]MDE6351690.1 efflux RND transporter periplasmic adaptor subunit [Muribaculaceae bacterium]MDE6643658.1 efflux RND transporter periplasmic adaptor subunit [Muribaculaceae bacterium]MDE7092158.1 efflux RND transporter periplasmic adaptor subunit [Muribaculaceae bacterium]
MKKFFKIFLWILVAVIFVGTFVYLFLNSSKKEAVYELVTPVTGDIERTTVLNGKIEPRDEIEIKPQVSGIISEINVEPGDLVKVGDVIAKIKIIPDESQLASARNRVRVAQLDLAEKKLEYERTKELYERKYESRERYEQDLNTYNKAQEEEKAALDALAIIREGVSPENAQSSNTLVRATITGLVLEVPVKVGSSVIQSNTFNDGTTIAKVADMNDLIFKGKIDETEVDMLTEGMPMYISIGAISESSLNAVIEKIAPIATEDNGTNTFEIKAAIAVDSTMNLRAGYSANARVVLARAANALNIPERVIEFSGDSTFVYVLKSDHPKQQFDRVAIKTGLSDGVNAQVVNGDITTESKLRGSEQK